MMTQSNQNRDGPPDPASATALSREENRTSEDELAGPPVPPHENKSLLTPLPQIAKATRYPY